MAIFQPDSVLIALLINQPFEQSATRQFTKRCTQLEKTPIARLANGLSVILLPLFIAAPVFALPDSQIAQATQSDSLQSDSLPEANETETNPTDQSNQLDLDPDLDSDLIESSPVLQRWLEEIPDVQAEIRRDPSFRTRLRAGYSQFPANQQAAGFNLGVEDVFLGESNFTASGDYQRTFNGEREAYGANVHYYVLPLGSYVNVAPLVGYRRVNTDRYNTDGVNVGVRLRVVPSRTAAADITLTQSWVAPGTNEEIGISTLSVGYAITPELRIAADLEKQNAPARKDSRVAVVLEWML